MTSNETKSGRGGAREGSGRPKGTMGAYKAESEKRTRNIGIRVSEAELLMIKEKASKSGKGLTDYIIDLIRDS